MAYKRLGDLLIMTGTITPEELDTGLQAEGRPDGRAAISAGIITEAELIEALRLQLAIEYTDLSKTTIPISMAQVVPKNIAKRFPYGETACHILGYTGTITSEQLEAQNKKTSGDDEDCSDDCYHRGRGACHPGPLRKRRRRKGY